VRDILFRGGREILRELAWPNVLLIIGGKQVVNLLPEGAPHNGMALEREREPLRAAFGDEPMAHAARS
jgi:hypothetical protein